MALSAAVCRNAQCPSGDGATATAELPNQVQHDEQHQSKFATACTAVRNPVTRRRGIRRAVGAISIYAPPCFANENMHMQRAKQGSAEMKNCPQAQLVQCRSSSTTSKATARSTPRRRCGGGSSIIIRTATATVTSKSAALYRGITPHMQFAVTRRDRFWRPGCLLAARHSEVP